jgi:hypothetical protein
MSGMAGMEAMLKGITAGSSAKSNPLLRSLLGAGASEEEYAQLAQQAEEVGSAAQCHVARRRCSLHKHQH